jgi:hypothetical protein
LILLIITDCNSVFHGHHRRSLIVFLFAGYAGINGFIFSFNSQMKK